ncbi:hypothetical protein TURU_020658 [Turdus rufiventris]|nr:hypothetical protein TURU_020658 [Turdus rufiventris]
MCAETIKDPVTEDEVAMGSQHHDLEDYDYENDQPTADPEIVQDLLLWLDPYKLVSASVAHDVEICVSQSCSYSESNIMFAPYVKPTVHPVKLFPFEMHMLEKPDLVNDGTEMHVQYKNLSADIQKVYADDISP